MNALSGNLSCPVELLRDGKGIHGVGVVDDAIPERSRPRIILRPDRLHEPGGSSAWTPVYQGITGGFRHGMFSRTDEEQLRRAIHHDSLRNAGLPWPPEHAPGVEYWSTEKRAQDRNRQIYHGLRVRSLGLVNSLIWTALGEAAHPDALRVARRFHFEARRSIYRAAACSPRALQLIDVFPVLGLAIYSGARIRGDLCHRQYGEAAMLVQILELARNAQALFERQPAREKRRLLNFLLSNCSWDDGEVVATFRQPFDLLAETTAIAARSEAREQAKSAESEIWLGNLDSNQD